MNLRHAASDGNFNVPVTMPLANHMSPIPNTTYGRYQQVNSVGFSSSSFDSSVQGGGQMNDRQSFGSGSMDAL